MGLHGGKKRTGLRLRPAVIMCHDASTLTGCKRSNVDVSQEKSRWHTDLDSAAELHAVPTAHRQLSSCMEAIAPHESERGERVANVAKKIVVHSLTRDCFSPAIPCKPLVAKN
jgi:hypothetical protein